MKKLIKALSIFAILMAMLITNAFINADATITLAAKTNVTIESEYISDTSIRYISTIYGIENADDITETTVYFEMGCDEIVINSTKKLDYLFKSISDKYVEKDNILYQVVTISDVDLYSGYTLKVYFEYTFSDSSSSKTNSCVNLLADQSYVLSDTAYYIDDGLCNIDMIFSSPNDNVTLSYKKHNDYEWLDGKLYSDGYYEYFYSLYEAIFEFEDIASYDFRITTDTDVFYAFAPFDNEEPESLSLDFSAHTLENAGNYYSSAYSNDNKWNTYGFNNNNNNSTWSYVRIGGKNNTNGEAFAKTTSTVGGVKAVVLDISKELANTYTDITVEAYKDGYDTITITQRVNPGFSGDLVIDNNGAGFFATDYFFEITFNTNNPTNTNGALELNSIRLTSHIHNYNVESIDDKYLAQAKNCEHGDLYYYSCECGNPGTETFEYGIGSGAHEYESSIESKPTKLSSGSMKYTCKHCGDVYYDTISPLGFEYPDTEYNTDITEIDDLRAICKNLPYKQTTTEYYYTWGLVSNISNTTYGNCTIVDANGHSFEIYGMYDYTGALRYDALTKKPVAEDFVILYGQIQNYNDKYEMMNARLYWLNDDDMTNFVQTPGDYSFTINSLSSGSYDTGNYGSFKKDSYEFIYYRAYNNNLLDNDGYLYDSLEGAFYNASSIRDISEIEFTYTSASSFKLLYGEDFINYTAITVPAGENRTATYELNDADYFKIQTDASDVSITSITVNYQYLGTSYPTYRAVEDNRINPTVYSGTLVAGSSYVDVPVDVTYNLDGTYIINKVKRYTYYTLDYVKNNPAVANFAAMLDPMDVINYYLAFNTFPANYVYPSAKNYNSSDYNLYNDVETCKSVFGNKVRGLSYYTRTDGYATSIPGVEASNGYYELDIDLNGTYSTSSRGVGRVVIWTSGIDHNGYDNNPVCVYTDDHYISFMEYLNDGTYSYRFSATELVTGYKYSNTKFPITYTN